MIQNTQILCLAVTSQSEELNEFGLMELISLFHQQNFRVEHCFVDAQAQYPYEIRVNRFKYHPFLKIRMEIEKLPFFEQMIQRSVLVNQLLIFLSEGATFEELAKLQIQPVSDEYIQNKAYSMRMEIITSYGINFTQNEKVDLIDKLTDALQMKNTVNLNDPDITYYLCVYETYRKPLKKKQQREQEQLNLPKERHYTLGVQIKGTLKRKQLNVISNFALADRIYLGPVTLANDLAFLMANQALVKQGDCILDPFAGTGSILVAGSHFGALCFGSEIDKELLQGYCIGKLNEKSSYYKEGLVKQRPYVWHNFRQYNMLLPDYIRMDINNDKTWSSQANGFFDSIITDPPYGLRASICKNKGLVETKEVSRNAIYEKMLEVGRRLLKVGGRLVYLLPIKRNNFDSSQLTDIPGYKLIDYREQVLADKRSRLLVTLEKLPKNKQNQLEEQKIQSE